MPVCEPKKKIAFFFCAHTHTTFFLKIFGIFWSTRHYTWLSICCTNVPALLATRPLALDTPNAPDFFFFFQVCHVGLFFRCLAVFCFSQCHTLFRLLVLALVLLPLLLPLLKRQTAKATTAATTTTATTRSLVSKMPKNDAVAVDELEAAAAAAAADAAAAAAPAAVVSGTEPIVRGHGRVKNSVGRGMIWVLGFSFFPREPAWRTTWCPLRSLPPRQTSTVCCRSWRRTRRPSIKWFYSSAVFFFFPPKTEHRRGQAIPRRRASGCAR